MLDLQKTIIDFCIDHIVWIIILEFLSITFTLLGIKEEWGIVKYFFEVILAILSCILVVLLILYLTPFVVNSF